MNDGAIIRIDPLVYQKMKDYVYRKHGSLYRWTKLEIEAAILNHIHKGE